MFLELFVGVFPGGRVLQAQPPADQESLVDLDLGRFADDPEEIAWGRDPFLTQRYEGKTLEEIPTESPVLSAIIFREGKAVAIVNHQIVRTGDRIGGGVVEEILSDRVLFKKRGTVVELRVDRFSMD